jgi:hypothetical protein
MLTEGCQTPVPTAMLAVGIDGFAFVLAFDLAIPGLSGVS